MSNNFYYCHVCGNILNRDELYRLVKRDSKTKKRKTLYQLCGKCLHNLTNRRYKLGFFGNNVNPTIYRIFAEPLIGGKSTQLYDVFDAQLEVILGLEVKKETLVLKTKGDKRIWTVFNVRHLLETNDVELLKLMDKLFQYQTDDEKQARRTKWQNAVGFNQPDADFLTGMAKKYEEGGHSKDVFTDRQLYAIRKRMLKYAQQITIILNS